MKNHQNENSPAIGLLRKGLALIAAGGVLGLSGCYDDGYYGRPPYHGGPPPGEYGGDHRDGHHGGHDDGHRGHGGHGHHDYDHDGPPPPRW